jgi:cyclic nucleotide gated channel alpha 2
MLADGEEPTWVSEYDGGSALEGPLSKQYLYCLYWSLTTMSTVGYGDIIPANDRERTFATFSLVVGALSFAFINGNVVGLLSTLDNQTALVEGKMEAVKEYVQWRSLPKELVIRIRRYYEHCE